MASAQARTYRVTLLIECGAYSTTALGEASRRIVKPDVPVAAIAERLVVRGAAATQRVVLARSAFAEGHPEQLDAAAHRVRTVIGDDDLGRSRLRHGFAAIDRVAERA